MIYVFTFLGEFGYELLNWQGVVRKFAKSKAQSDTVICCGRTGLEQLYEFADQYVDISEVRSFKESVAIGYFAVSPTGLSPSSTDNRRFDRRLRKELRAFVRQSLGLGRDRRVVFIFSSQKTPLGECTFGADSRIYTAGDGDIYEHLALDNNCFRRIDPDLSRRATIEEELRMDLDEPFVLCQARNRSFAQRSPEHLEKERLIHRLAREIKIILLSFETGRKLDSYSRFEDISNCKTYKAKTFGPQSCLVHFSNQILFFTEGDFGSHIYVPPFLGKDVTAVAHRSIYQIGTTPIEFWNERVFRFGGQIIPKIADEVLGSESATSALVEEILVRAG